jgi:hypothetical protein
MRSTILPHAVCLLALAAVPCAAQDGAFGLGARMSLIRGDVDADPSAERFTGAHLRARVSPHTGIELSLDIRSERNQQLTKRVRDYPLQASLLLFPIRARFAPYVLGGGGWYSHHVETLSNDTAIDSDTTRKFGWHAGFGGELRLGRHAGLHADYRYTFLHFGSDGVESDTIAGAINNAYANDSGKSRFLPSYDGSIWSTGITVYF